MAHDVVQRVICPMSLACPVCAAICFVRTISGTLIVWRCESCYFDHHRSASCVATAVARGSIWLIATVSRSI